MAVPALVLGIGNQFRHDDFAGVEAVRRLKEIGRGIRCEEQSGDGVQLMETWKGLGRVILIDAVSSSATPGTVHKIHANHDPLPKNWFSCSTHTFSIAEAVEMSKALEALPESLCIYGIEGKCFEPGEGLSQEVDNAIDNVVQEILDSIG